jgi:wobble nucleotide-excising tRNase
MIRKIRKIKNFQTFRDFSWPSGLDEFGRFNLIYGWNGTGKTAISRILRFIEKKAKINIVFEIESDDAIIKSSELSDSPSIPLIRVFNKDFVEENVFQTNGSVNPIYYLGEESIAKQKELQGLKEQKSGLLKQQEDFHSNYQIRETEFNSFLTDGGVSIKNLLSAPDEYIYIRYDKRKFENKCEELSKLNNYAEKKLSSSTEAILIRNKDADSKEKLEPANLSIIDVKETKEKASTLISKTVAATVITRLKEDSSLNEWARIGYDIHKGKDTNTCQFCGQKLPAGFFESFESHFNDEYMSLIAEMDSLISTLSCSVAQVTKLTLPSKSLLYDELSDVYDESRIELGTDLEMYRTFLEKVVSELKRKKVNPFIVEDVKIEVPVLDLAEKLAIVNGHISQHNKRTDNYDEERNEAKKKLEESFVANKLEEYIKKKSEVTDLSSKIGTLQSQITAITSKIRALETEISRHQKPAEEMNKDIERYLGHNEIQFCIKENGYCITRNADVAEALSEGEKTAIGFTYFLKTLRDKDFDLRKGIVVIDDPVSSLDSNAIFQAFGFMKENTKEAQQVFIFTHNFTFFRQVKNWFEFINKRKKEARFFMLRCSSINSVRTSLLQNLDKLLEEYESEYHYLFSQVYEYSMKRNEDLQGCYHLPNMARRLLEAFLAFRIPKQTRSLYGKLEALDFSETKKTRIRRFVDSHSHSDHIEDGPEHDISILSETADVLKDILDLIKAEDEKHYNQMVEIVRDRTE